MTNALQSLAGDSIRNALMRFTHSPLSGALTGAAGTAVLQSSSATTVAAVGFVGAGLMSFPQSLGIIFGANVGTTITGWIVVLLGFKLKLSTVILPFIFIGSSMRLFAKGAWSSAGLAIAGFGLIFVGISTMQEGMGALQSVVTPAHFPSDNWLGRLELVLSGVVITLVTQSSSAGVAATLTALYAGAINFNQGAALVIGMDVGTTVTAVMASIGGSVSSRRTAVSHVIYNLMTGIGALLILDWYVALWQWLAPGQLVPNAEIALVGFHSLFNVLGLVVILPFATQFSSLVKTLVRQPPAGYTACLDKRLLGDGAAALSVLFATTKNELLDLLGYLKFLLRVDKSSYAIDMSLMQRALDDTHRYADLIQIEQGKSQQWCQLLSMFHILDHLQRLHERLEEDFDRARVATQLPQLGASMQQLNEALDELMAGLKPLPWKDSFELFEPLARQLLEHCEKLRGEVMAEVAAGRLSVPEATRQAEAIRWLRRCVYHVYRITFHLQRLNQALYSG